MLDYNSFFTAQDGTALTATAASANYINLANARDIGVGNDLVVVVLTGDADFESGGSSTLDIALQSAQDSSGSPGTYYTIAQSQQIAKASMTANTQIAEIAVPADLVNGVNAKYLRLNFTVGTANFTTGKLIAYLTKRAEHPYAYPRTSSFATL